jgi:hypothetical protein
MLEKLYTGGEVSILQCQEIAKDVGFDSMTFDLCGPKGSRKAKWQDAYFGFFKLEGEDGLFSASQLQFAQDLWCENLMLDSD